jgi:hypothetical protein
VTLGTKADAERFFALRPVTAADAGKIVTMKVVNA